MATSFPKLSFIDSAQFPVHVRHVHVLRCPADLPFDDFATLLRDELHQCVIEEYPFFSGVLGTGFDGAVQVLDVDVNKVAERVRVDIGTTLHSVTTAQLHGGDVQALLADWQSPSEEHWTCAARISRCIIDGDDNGVAVGVGVSHRIGDAASVGRFVVRWATRCRARLGREPSVHIPASYLEAPSFDKSTFIPFAADARRAAKELKAQASIVPLKEVAADAPADAAADAIQPADGAPWFEREECQTWRLRFRNDVLKRLQDSAEVRERGLPLSRNDFILAATSQAITKAMLAAGFVADSEGVAVSLPMDFRGRTRRHAPIPANYFGNALVIVDRCFDRVSEVSDASLVDTAIAVHKAIRAVAESEDEIAKKMSALALGGSLFDGIPPKLVALTLSSWVHSGLHCVDFTGSSHVWATNVQNPPFPFLGHLVPSPGGAGVDIAMALPLSVATALRAHVAQGHEFPFSLEGRMA